MLGAYIHGHFDFEEMYSVLLTLVLSLFVTDGQKFVDYFGLFKMDQIMYILDKSGEEISKTICACCIGVRLYELFQSVFLSALCASLPAIVVHVTCSGISSICVTFVHPT